MVSNFLRTGILQGNPERVKTGLSKSRELTETQFQVFIDKYQKVTTTSLIKSRIGEQAIGATNNMDRDSNS